MKEKIQNNFLSFFSLSKKEQNYPSFSYIILIVLKLHTSTIIMNLYYISISVLFSSLEIATKQIKTHTEYFGKQNFVKLFSLNGLKKKELIKKHIECGFTHATVIRNQEYLLKLFSYELRAEVLRNQALHWLFSVLPRELERMRIPFR